MNANEILPIDCERCHGELEQCGSAYPWNEDFWICVECGSTYVKEYIKDIENGNSTTSRAT